MSTGAVIGLDIETHLARDNLSEFPCSKLRTTDSTYELHVIRRRLLPCSCHAIARNSRPTFP